MNTKCVSKTQMNSFSGILHDMAFLNGYSQPQLHLCLGLPTKF